MTHEKVALITGITGRMELICRFCWKIMLFTGLNAEAVYSIPLGLIIYVDQHQKDAKLKLHGDLTDSSSLIRIIEDVQPDEIYNLAAQSHVAVSFEEPEYTANSDAIGPLRILEAIRILNLRIKQNFIKQAPLNCSA